MPADSDLLDRILERDQYATDQWKDAFDQAKTDQRVVSGDPWEPKDRQAREAAGRPCLSLDEINQYLNQVSNDVLANPRGMKFTPRGAGANDKTAQFYTDYAREVEYRSKAQIAYGTAFRNCLESSMGWVELDTAHESYRSFNSDVTISHVPNPLMVRADPDAQMPDSSDMRYLIKSELWRISEFKRTFPKAKVMDFGPEAKKAAPNWVDGDQIKLAEYWEKEAYDRQLLLLTQPGTPNVYELFRDELEKTFPDGVPGALVVAREETREDHRIKSYLTNGLEILKEYPWKGRYIPFASCFGKILYVDEGSGAKRKIMSMVRLARDPYLLYCYYRTCEAEMVGMTPKFPYFVYEGQLAPDQLEALQKSLHEPVAVIVVKPSVPLFQGATGSPMPFPQRQPYEPPLAGLEMASEAARRAIQAAMGISPLPTPAQRNNEKTGRALERITESEQKGAYHFVNAYDGMITQVGVIFEDLVTPTVDTARTMTVRDRTNESYKVRVNDPTVEGSIDTSADHAVTVSAGPSFDDERDAAADFADSLSQNPQYATVLGPLIIKMRNLGPIGDEMVDILIATLPPPIQMLYQGKNNPQQAAGQLMQAQMQIQHLTQQNQQMMQALQAKLPELQEKLREAEIDAQVRQKVAEINASATIGSATIKANNDQALETMRIELENIRAIVAGINNDKQFAHEIAQQVHEHVHDVNTQAMSQAHDAATQAADHAHDATTQAAAQAHEIATMPPAQPPATA